MPDLTILQAEQVLLDIERQLAAVHQAIESWLPADAQRGNTLYELYSVSGGNIAGVKMERSMLRTAREEVLP